MYATKETTADSKFYLQLWNIPPSRLAQAYSLLVDESYHVSEVQAIRIQKRPKPDLSQLFLKLRSQVQLPKRDNPNCSAVHPLWAHEKYNCHGCTHDWSKYNISYATCNFVSGWCSERINHMNKWFQSEFGYSNDCDRSLRRWKGADIPFIIVIFDKPYAKYVGNTDEQNSCWKTVHYAQTNCFLAYNVFLPWYSFSIANEYIPWLTWVIVQFASLLSFEEWIRRRTAIAIFDCGLQ